MISAQTDLDPDPRGGREHVLRTSEYQAGAMPFSRLANAA